MNEENQLNKRKDESPSKTKKDKMVRIRVTENELKELKKLAEESGMTVSDFFRFLVWGESK